MVFGAWLWQSRPGPDPPLLWQGGQRGD